MIVTEDRACPVIIPDQPCPGTPCRLRGVSCGPPGVLACGNTSRRCRTRVTRAASATRWPRCCWPPWRPSWPARSLAAIGEWAADAPPGVLAALGVRFDPLAPPVPAAGRGDHPPGPGVGGRRPLDAAVTSWLASTQLLARAGAARWPWTARPCAAPGTPPPTARPRTCWPPSTSRPGPSSRRPPWRARPMRSPVRAAAGAAGPGRLRRHRRCAATQREHAEFLVTSKKADYILVVKGTSPACTPSFGGCPEYYPSRRQPAQQGPRPR